MLKGRNLMKKGRKALIIILVIVAVVGIAGYIAYDTISVPAKLKSQVQSVALEFARFHYPCHCRFVIGAGDRAFRIVHTRCVDTRVRVFDDPYGQLHDARLYSLCGKIPV